MAAGPRCLEVCSSTEMGAPGARVRSDRSSSLGWRCLAFGNGRQWTQNRPKQTTISPGANGLPSRDLPQLADERQIAKSLVDGDQYPNVGIAAVIS